MMPPLIARVRIRSAQGKSFGLWLPLFALWLLLPLAAPVVLLAAFAAGLIGVLRRRERPWNPLLACWYGVALLWRLRGVQVRAGDSSNHVRLWIA